MHTRAFILTIWKVTGESAKENDKNYILFPKRLPLKKQRLIIFCKYYFMKRGKKSNQWILKEKHLDLM